MQTFLEFNEIQQKMVELPSWEFSSSSINKTYQLSNFKQAMKFINLVGDAAEEMNHHPDILLFEWNKVRFTLSTHSIGGLTQLDFDLSKKIENIFNNLNFEV